MFNDIRDFHNKFKLNYDGQPRELPAHLSHFRRKFLNEELQEYHVAVESGDLAKQFDALMDLVYVALGTAYLQGFPWQEGWDEVHHKNMIKERTERVSDSTRGSKYDVVKPKGWTPPDIDSILQRCIEAHQHARLDV